MDEFLEQLRASLTSNTALAPAIVSSKKEDYEKPLGIEPTPNVSGDIEQDLNFDGAGNAYYTFSKAAVGLTVHLTAFIAGLDAIFDIWLDADGSPGHQEWHGVRQSQQIGCALKTKIFGSTTVKVKIHSSVPNSKAIVHLHYST